MIKRTLHKVIQKRLGGGKAVILMGPRQAGKTTLLNDITNEYKGRTLWLNADEADVREMLTNTTSANLRNLFGNNELVVIDEAQRVENIGICLKLITDNLKKIKVIASGSSSFDLANKINEPLTGRKWEFSLYPLSYGEMVKHHGLLEEKRMVEHRLIYGYYPDVVTNPGDEQEILKQLADSNMYKDILTWESIKKPDRLERLVQSLAFQVGHEVSYNELGQQAGLDNETVERYINLLEKSFIIFRLSAFSRNLRNELKKSRKIYFYDNGLRNAIIKQFNHIKLRNDHGALWENFMVSERKKYLEYNRLFSNTYFWRTHAQQEIDYIEDREATLHAFEFKWNPKATKKFPASFLEAYPNNTTHTVHPQNMDGFLL